MRYQGRSSRAGGAPVAPPDHAPAEFEDAPRPTVPPSPARSPLLGGRYALVGELARGRTTRTFRAHDKVLDRDVVVKIVSGGDASDQRQRAHVLAEARAAGRVVHPNVATVLDVVEERDIVYMVCELAEGRSLAALLRESGRLGPAEAVEIATQVADALAAIHQQQMVHGALTFESIVVTPDHVARVVDLNTARISHVTDSLSTDPRTDVYALGALLYMMLTGESSFTDPVEPSRHSASVPPDLDDVVLTALAHDPVRRYQTAAELRDALRKVGKRSTTDTQVMRRPVLSPDGRPSGRRHASAPRMATATPPPPVPVAEPAVQARRSRTASSAPARRTSGPSSRTLLWISGLLAGLAILALASAYFWMVGGSPSSQAGERWATFARQSCEWSNVTTPPGICFGERPVGHRVRVLDQSGARWMIWDPTTQGQAFVDADALKPE